MTLKYFKLEEFACHHCGVNLIDYDFVMKLDKLRERVGFPLAISSGYRCPDHNAKVSKTGRTGPHTSGHAADIAVSHAKGLRTFARGAAHWLQRHWDSAERSGRFIHLDDLPDGPGQPRPTLFSY